MQKYYDVAVVGGGPIGGHVVKEIAQRGFKVAIFEEHKQIGEPLKCAGLVTSRIFDFLDVPQKRVVQNKIKGVHIHSPSGDTLTVGGDKVYALVIDRPMLDKEIIKTSIEKGTEVFLGNKILSAKKRENHIELKTSQNEDGVNCKLLIGADGPLSKIREQFNLPQPKETLQGIGAEITDISLNPDFVEIFVGNNIAPGFFAWIIPTNKHGTEARVGLCISQDSPYPPRCYFSNLFKNKHSSTYLKNVEITKKIGGVVPLGALKKTYAPNVLLVGDAAAQVKPTSGGGIYTGLLCASHCSTVALEALHKNDFTSHFLKKYHRLWSADIGRELNLGMKFRTIFKNLTDQQIDKYIKKFQNPRTTEVISRYGDIDYPSKLVLPLFKTNPSLIKLLPKTIKR